MAESRKDSPIAPRRSLGGPILPPPPPELAEEAEEAEEAEAKRQQAERSGRTDAGPSRDRSSREKPSGDTSSGQKSSGQKSAGDRAAGDDRPRAPQAGQSTEPVTEERAPSAWESRRADRAARKAAKSEKAERSRAGRGRKTRSGPRRTRRAQLRLVQVDAWSVMKTSFLLSIALGIVLVVAVSIIWAVLGAAGVWDSINSIVEQAVGSDGGKAFDIQEYAGTSRVLGLTMIVAVLDVILITAIATLGAFLYNLSAALLGGIEVTLAEDS